MSVALKIGYARVSTQGQDLTAQRNALAALGVDAERMYVDHGLTGTNRARPGLREALAACRAGDMLVVTKLDRLARSVPDARDIADELTAREIKLNLGGAVHDPTDPVGRLLFNVLAMVAEFESDLIRMRTREGMAVARAAGKLRGRKPKLRCSCPSDRSPQGCNDRGLRATTASPANRGSCGLLLPTRVAGCRLLPYGQCVARIVTQRTDDVELGDGWVQLRLGEEPVDEPQPVASLVRALRERSSGPWLRPAQSRAPTRAERIRRRLRALGIRAE